MIKKETYEELILNALIEMNMIKDTEKRLVKENKDVRLQVKNKTSKVVARYEIELDELKIKHFERFIKLILEVRNAGNKKKGYRKDHFIGEFKNYLHLKGLDK